MGFPNFSGPHGKKQMVPVKISVERGRARGILRSSAVKTWRRLALGFKSLTHKEKSLSKRTGSFLGGEGGI